MKRYKQMEIVDLFGSVEYDSEYNYKEGRKKR